MPAVPETTTPRSRHWGRGPTVWLLIVLGLTALVRFDDLRWCIKDNPAFTHSIHSDEARKIAETLSMRPSFEGLRPSPWLLGTGPLLPTLGTLLYGLVANTPLRGAFEAIAGVPLDSPAGSYLLLRSISAIASLLLAYFIFQFAAQLSGSGYAGVLAAFFFSTASPRLSSA